MIDGAIERAQKLDRDDHNTNGALQFVAKLLEIWFMIVAAGLVYDVGLLFARKGGGLPIGYLLTHLEFTDLRYIFNPLLWTSPLPHRHSAPENRMRIVKLYFFAILTALLTILANLMGPATAVLVLPTLQWIDTPHVMNSTFNGTNVMFPPQASDTFDFCNETQILAHNYSCTSGIFADSLDALAAQGIASITESWSSDGIILWGVTQEEALQFAYNGTGDKLTWIANRQVLREMSHEYLKTQGLFAESDPPEYPDKRYNNSLQTILQRQGPSFGVQTSCYSGEIIDFELDDDNYRWVRCYTGWTLDGISYYNKCLRLGQGFNNTNLDAQFSLEVVDPAVEESELGVGVYFADKATYYNETTSFGSGIKACVENNETSIQCDWDTVFDSSDLPPELKNTSINVGVVSYRVPGASDDSRVWCDHVTYQSFPDYSVDTRFMSNPLSLVTLNNLPGNATFPQIVNPDWFLAAWSADNEGSVDGNRKAVKELVRVLPAYYNTTWNDTASIYDRATFSVIHMYTLGQALSLVPYTTTPPPSLAEAEQANKDKNVHPVLHTWATTHVWAYGISGRTAKLGVAVVSLGALCVLARFLVGIRIGISGLSTVEVLAAAFEHRHQGELDGLEEETHLAKVRYTVAEEADGKHRFIPQKRISRWSHASRI